MHGRGVRVRRGPAAARGAAWLRPLLAVQAQEGGEGAGRVCAVAMAVPRGGGGGGRVVVGRNERVGRAEVDIAVLRGDPRHGCVLCDRAVEPALENEEAMECVSLSVRTE
jgi:hypothetical protein